MSANIQLQKIHRVSSNKVKIEDTAPARTRNFIDLMYSAFSFAFVLLILLITNYTRGITSGVALDARNAISQFNWLVEIPSTLLQQLLSITVVIVILCQMLIQREWVQGLFTVVSTIASYALITLVSIVLFYFAPDNLVHTLIVSGEPNPTSIIPDIYAGLATFLTVAGPRLLRPSVRWCWNSLFILASLQIALGIHGFSTVLISFAFGRSLGLLFRFIFGVPNSGIWGMHIIHSLRNINLHINTLTRKSDTSATTHLIRSHIADDLVENSRIYEATDEQNNEYIISVLDSQKHSVGYLNQV
ncbi:MAG: TIGR00374 family protein, partial [Bifidobacteriaceae bacterium]|nr:TIGR00374 family protein [Bifidobacteriaceae bacterium]